MGTWICYRGIWGVPSAGDLGEFLLFHTPESDPETKIRLRAHKEVHWMLPFTDWCPQPPAVNAGCQQLTWALFWSIAFGHMGTASVGRTCLLSPTLLGNPQEMSYWNGGLKASSLDSRGTNSVVWFVLPRSARDQPEASFQPRPQLCSAPSPALSYRPLTSSHEVTWVKTLFQALLAGASLRQDRKETWISEGGSQTTKGKQPSHVLSSQSPPQVARD